MKLYATVYGVTENGYCHGCIHYPDGHTLSGAMKVIEVKQYAKKAGNLPVYDITKASVRMILDSIDGEEKEPEVYGAIKINI